MLEGHLASEVLEVIMIIRATQKKMMSKPVTSTEEDSRKGPAPASSQASPLGWRTATSGGEPGVEHVFVTPVRVGCPRV